jgi:hypothetical protein
MPPHKLRPGLAYTQFKSCIILKVGCAQFRYLSRLISLLEDEQRRTTEGAENDSP